MASRAPRTTISSFLAQADMLSIELGKRVMDPIEVKTYIDSFESIVVPKSGTQQAFAKMYHHGGVDMTMKNLGSGNISIFKEQNKFFKIDPSTRAVSTKITPITSTTNMAESIDIIVQFGFVLMAHNNWALRIDLVKRLENSAEFSTKLSSTKEALVNVPLEKMNPSAIDFVSTELVRINNEPITHSELMEIIDLVTPDVDDQEKYQDAIFSIAKDIYRDGNTIAKFRRESGFKRLCPNPVELNRPIYFKQVLPNIENYFMTDKMDGIHAVLVIDELYTQVRNKRNYIGAHIYAVSDQIYEISPFINHPKAIVEHTVLDTEMMVDKKGERSFHCFDVIALASKRIVGIPFGERLNRFKAVDALMDKHELGSVKEFIRLTKDKYCEQIKTFYAKKRDYAIDGIILTPTGSFYKDAIKLRKNRMDRIYNTEYSNTITFKWKPLDQLTIDFYLMAHPTKKGAYVLCSGVDRKTFDQLKLSFFEGYKAPVSPRAFQYFPIQFETYDGAFDYVWTPTEKSENLNGMVGEFRFADKNGRLQIPQMIRLRTDRVQDIAKGEYYGNALRYSELIWHSIQHPLLIDDLCAPTSSAYFAGSDDGWYKASRGFNSFVKTYLMETYLLPGKDARLMDVAAGRGQDLARAVELGYTEIVALDKDVDALSELLERKYNLRVRVKNAAANIHVKQIDLEDSAEESIKALKLPKESADSVMINFAIHYICHAATAGKQDPITEFVKLCSFYLKSGGKVMITAFNGEDVFDKLKESDEWSVSEHDRVKYSIKKAFQSTELTNVDQGIDVLLPFSNGNYYREYLVNYQYIQTVFEAHGFKLVKTDSFGSLIRTFKQQNARGFKELTQGDKEYVALYGYMIFEKK